MSNPIFVTKETKTGYITIIIGTILLFLGMLAVGIIMLNSSQLDSSITEKLSITLYVAGIIYIIIITIVCVGIIFYCIEALNKKHIDFYDSYVAIMFGYKQVYLFYYQDIIMYHIFKRLSNCNILVSKFFHHKRGEIKGRMLDISLSKEDLERVLKILEEKCPNAQK